MSEEGPSKGLHKTGHLQDMGSQDSPNPLLVLRTLFPSTFGALANRTVHEKRNTKRSVNVECKLE